MRIKPSRNLEAQIFGHLAVIHRAGTTRQGKALWACRCDCSAQTEVTVTTGDLVSGHTTSCGCSRRMDETGNTFGELTVIRFVRILRGQMVFECRCTCGKTCEVSGGNLRAVPGTISCGHVLKFRRGPGISHAATKHGGRCLGESEPAYRAWRRGQVANQSAV